MEMEATLRPEILNYLGRLGTVDWLVMDLKDYDETRENDRFDMYLSIPPKLWGENSLGGKYIRFVVDQYRKKVARLPDLLDLFSFSKYLAMGPKVFEPTYEQCVAMEHVKAKLPISMYQQPYPVLKVLFPKAYREKLSNELQFDCPDALLCYHLNAKAIIVSSSSPRSSRDVVGVMASRNPDTELESVITARELMQGQAHDIDMANAEWLIHERIQRLAVMMNLLLCNYPIELNYIPGHETNERNKLRERAKASRSATRELQATKWKDVQTIKFVQEISFYGKERTASTTAGKGGTHASPIPHWREGYFRREMGYRELLLKGEKIKRVFIKPVLVNDKLFVGNLSETKVTYISK